MSWCFQHCGNKNRKVLTPGSVAARGNSMCSLTLEGTSESDPSKFGTPHGSNVIKKRNKKTGSG